MTGYIGYSMIPDYPHPADYTAALDEYGILYSMGYGFGVGGDFTSLPERVGDILLYLPGSGATGMYYGWIMERWLAEGSDRFYMTTQWSGSLMQEGLIPDTSSPSSAPKTAPFRLSRPSRYGYGNVNSPLFASGFCKAAHHVNALIGPNGLLDMYEIEYNSITILGHSAGSTAALSYLAGYHGGTINPKLKGVVLNSPTQAGLGTGTWNNPARLTNSFSQLFGLELPVRTLVSYADDDLYAPPDMARRYQACIPDGAQTYFVSPGLGGHHWMSAPTSGDMLFRWINQARNGDLFTLRDGITLAKPGAASAN